MDASGCAPSCLTSCRSDGARPGLRALSDRDRSRVGRPCTQRHPGANQIRSPFGRSRSSARWYCRSPAWASPRRRSPAGSPSPARAADRRPRRPSRTSRPGDTACWCCARCGRRSSRRRRRRPGRRNGRCSPPAGPAALTPQQTADPLHHRSHIPGLDEVVVQDPRLGARDPRAQLDESLTLGPQQAGRGRPAVDEDLSRAGLREQDRDRVDLDVGRLQTVPGPKKPPDSAKLEVNRPRPCVVSSPRFSSLSAVSSEASEVV